MRKSRWSLHVEKYGKGCGNEICNKATKICLARGSIPCDILFVGEAPGDSEDVVGVPFCGPAGTHFQSYVVDLAVPPGLKYSFVNLTGCIPLDETNTKRTDGPTATEIMCCSVRLREVIEICNPKLIVCVGDLAKDWLEHTRKISIWHKYEVRQATDRTLRPVPVIMKGKGPIYLSDKYQIPRCHVTHPAAILRKSIADQGLLWQRSQLALEDAIMTHVTNVPPLPDGSSPF